MALRAEESKGAKPDPIRSPTRTPDAAGSSTTQKINERTGNVYANKEQ
jgi:hypothetical protein